MNRKKELLWSPRVKTKKALVGFGDTPSKLLILHLLTTHILQINKKTLPHNVPSQKNVVEPNRVEYHIIEFKRREQNMAEQYIVQQHITQYSICDSVSAVPCQAYSNRTGLRANLRTSMSEFQIA